MPGRITNDQVLFAAIAALMTAGLACGSVPAPPDGTGIETESPGAPPTWPPTWTPTWTPTAVPTSPSTAVPTSMPTVDALPTAVAPTAVPPMIEFPVSDLDDLEIGASEVVCEPNEDTLIEASQDCSPASMMCSATVDIFGMLMTAQTFYEIQGMVAGRCVLYVGMDEMSVRFSEELVQLMLEDEGVTLEDIRQMEEEANEELAQFQGRDGVCRFDSTEDLAAWLGAMKEGASYSGSCEFVDGEWQCDEGEGSPECEGDLFEGTLE
jgi:hypothetical protein